ncbi:MAG: hypothetical protein NTX72_01075 [Candidatus Uhrbacteria bacterium]|nr:hypothetical protein [Candidatus Uhrbacteria bacterium]
MSNKNLVPVWYVEYTMQMVRHFCKKYECPERDLQSCTTAITIALREQDDFEWTPCVKGFRRILFIKPQIREEKRVVALVFGYDNLDQTLTNELNESIRRACDNKWAD